MTKTLDLQIAMQTCHQSQNKRPGRDRIIDRQDIIIGQEIAKIYDCRKPMIKEFLCDLRNISTKNIHLGQT